MAANPEPDTVTVEPALPLVGFREIVGVTVNVAMAVFEPASVHLTALASSYLTCGNSNGCVEESRAIRCDAVGFTRITDEPANVKLQFEKRQNLNQSTFKDGHRWIHWSGSKLLKVMTVKLALAMLTPLVAESV